MSSYHHSKARQIHPRALKELGEEACIVALGVARDLRSGVITAAEFNMRTVCGSACCIAGHLAMRMKKGPRLFWFMRSFRFSALDNLFSPRHPSDPHLAANAIERYIYDGSETPWKT